MKKVLYNNCYGGFNLSPLAITEYRKKKGLETFWYKCKWIHGTLDKEFTKLDHIPARNNLLEHYATSKDLGKYPKYLSSYAIYYGDFEELRDDKDLIEVVEDLGLAANGFHANIKIAEIPCNAPFEIDEYDGFETVVPPRHSWEDF